MLLVAQGNALAEHILGDAQSRDLPLEGAIGVGQTDEEGLIRLLGLCATLNVPALLVALHRPPSAELLWRLGALERRVLLMLVGRARGPVALRSPALPLPAPGTADLARAAGIPAAGCPAELVELAHLQRLAFTAAPTRVSIRARGEDDAALAHDAITRAGLHPVGAASDLTIVTPGAPVPPTGRWLRLTPASRRPLTPREARHETLAALGILARLPSAGPPSRPSTRAHALLDGWHRELTEVMLEPVLACYGIKMPPSGLAQSASMAGVLARQLGGPVAVKAVAPALNHRLDRGATRLDVQGVSAARQAFRDVLQACDALRPRPDLDGVLVQTMVPAGPRLQCLIRWATPSDQPQPPLMLLRLPPHDTGVHPCPLGDSDALDIARSLWTGPLPPLARLLRQLSRLASDLTGRMRWLWIDSISLPAPGHPPRVLDAVGEQTESLRRGYTGLL